MKKTARGWILYRPDPALVKQESYEIDRLVETAPRHGYHVEVVSPDDVELLVNTDGESTVFIQGKRAELPDFVIPRMGSLTDYFCIAILRHLKRLGVVCVNDASAVELAQDKLFQLQVLADAGVAVPKTLLFRFPVDPEVVDNNIGYPVVVKTLVGTQGSGVHLCKTRDELVDVLQFVEANNPSAQLILQQFLSESKGRDIRVFAVGGHVVAAMERIAAKGFKSNYSQGGRVERVEVGPRDRMAITEIMRILDMDVIGLDALYDDKRGYRVCEVNSSPGFEGLEEATGVDVAEYFFRYLDGKFHVSDMMLEQTDPQRADGTGQDAS